MTDTNLLVEARQFLDGADALLDDDPTDVRRVRSYLAEADERIRAVMGA